MGRGGGPALWGKALDASSSIGGERDPCSSGCSPGRVSWVDLFLVCGLSGDRIAGLPKKECLPRVFPCVFPVFKCRRTERGRWKERKKNERKQRNTKEKREIKTLKPFTERLRFPFPVPLKKGVESLGRAPTASQSSDGSPGVARSHFGSLKKRPGSNAELSFSPQGASGWWVDAWVGAWRLGFQNLSPP